MDTRSPQTIFKSEFSAWGSNKNLAEYASGASCARIDGLYGTKTTAFIALTSNLAFARKLARVASGVARDGLSYIYALCSNEHMYDLGASLQASDVQAQGLIIIAQHQSEWIADGRILPQDIIRVETYVRGRYVDSNLNPRYREEPGYVNPAPFVSDAQPSSAPRSIYFTRVGSILSTLCAAALPCVHNSTEQ
jgi:hypothetical protein